MKALMAKDPVLARPQAHPRTERVMSLLGRRGFAEPAKGMFGYKHAEPVETTSQLTQARSMLVSRCWSVDAEMACLTHKMLGPKIAKALKG